MHHVTEFCHLTGRGLGPWSEQYGVAIHQDFKHFKINDTQNKNYENILFRHCLHTISNIRKYIYQT